MREIPCCFECWPGGPVTPAAVPPLRLERELFHLGIVRPLPSSRARPEIPEMGIARETAPPPGESRVLPGLPGVGCHRPLRVDVRGLQILAGEIRHRRPVRHLRPAGAGQPGRVVPAVPQAPQPGRPAARPPDRDRHPGRSQRARPAAVHRRDLAPGRHDPPRVREEDRPGGHDAAAPGRPPAARLVRHAPGPAAGVVGQVPATP